MNIDINEVIEAAAQTFWIVPYFPDLGLVDIAFNDPFILRGKLKFQIDAKFVEMLVR